MPKESTFAKLKYHAGVKMRIFLSDNQKQIIDKNINASRFVYNEFVAINKELYRLRQVKTPIKLVLDRIEYLEWFQSSAPTQKLMFRHPWMKATGIGTDVVDQARMTYQAAWNNFKKVHHTGVPKFHKKRVEGSFRIPQRYPKKIKDANIQSMFNGNIRFEDTKHVVVSLISRVRVSGSHTRFFSIGEHIWIGTTTVSKDATGRYYVSMQLGSDEPFVKSVPKTNKKLGIDLNTENFLTTSDNDVVENPRYYRMITKKLRKQQRKLSRRQLRARKENRNLRESKNYQKQRTLVAELHRRVRNRRQNFLSNVSTTLIKNHDLVVAEELRSKNMLRNHALAMSISDVGWRTFLTMLENKATMYGHTFVSVSPRNTTQTCSDCGYLLQGAEKLTLKDRFWTCPSCGADHIRDHNASINILHKGQAKLAQA